MLNMTSLWTKNDNVVKYMAFCGGKNGDFTASVKKFSNICLSTECMNYGHWVAAVDCLTLGSSLYSPDATRPYRQALCAP